MALRKRAIAALAAGALLVPLFGSPASANHIDIRETQRVCPAQQNDENRFSDVDDSDPFVEEINCIAAYGVTVGRRSATQYDPRAEVTRQQMALFIFRVGVLAGFKFDTSDAGFTDLDLVSDRGTRDAINGLGNAGIVRGTGRTATEEKPFSPRASIQRQSMATFISELQEKLGVRGFSTTRDFFDDDEDSLHEQNINNIASEGVTVGNGGGANNDRRYGPTAFVLRQSMAAFLSRKMDILVEQGFFDSRFVPTILDAVIATDAASATDGATATDSANANDEQGTASQNDAFDVTFDEDLTTFNGGTLTVEDADGTTAVIECGADPSANTNVAATCVERTNEAQSENDSSTSTIRFTLRESGTVEAGNPLSFPLEITDVEGFTDADGNQVNLANSEDTTIDSFEVDRGSTP